MPDLLRFLLKYGYVVIFGAAFAEQIGLPLPAVPLLVGMGALSRSGAFSFPIVVLTGLIGSLAADLIWFVLGWFHGRSVLRLICRISLEPDYCVRRTEDAFERHGLWALLLAKFVPGLNAAAVPLAGMVETPFLRFLVFDVAGLILWTGAYASLGHIFSRQIEALVFYLSRLGVSLLILAGSALTAYIGYKAKQRHSFLKTISVARITPEELKAKMDAKEDIVILDVRNQLDRNTDPVRIPGAFHVLPEHVEFQPEDLPFDREIVVYCT
jgi:membrane protein DedA with SNARE-associated domain